jgi:hypothetical protein
MWVSAALSLALAVATAALSVWSNYAKWERLEVARCEVTELLDDNGRAYLADERYRGVLFESGSVVLYRLWGRVNAGPKSHWEFNERVVGRNLREPGQLVWAASESGPAYAEVGVRSWVVIAAFSIVPVWWTIVVIRRARRDRRGLCSQCGYDLRATPDRCPECGAVPAPPAPAAA